MRSYTFPLIVVQQLPLVLCVATCAEVIEVVVFVDGGVFVFTLEVVVAVVEVCVSVVVVAVF